MKKLTLFDKIYRSLIKNFVKGLFLLAPLFITIFLVSKIVVFFDNHMAAGIPGLGIVMLLSLSTLFGYLASYIFPAYRKIGLVLQTVPFINLIYASFRDIAYAFSSRRSKYRQPVLVQKDGEGIYRIGFITKNSLEDIGFPDLVAVYLLKSHSILGEIVIIEKDKLTKLNAESSDILRFIVSGGFSGFGKDKFENELKDDTENENDKIENN